MIPDMTPDEHAALEDAGDLWLETLEGSVDDVICFAARCLRTALEEFDRREETGSRWPIPEE